MPDYNILVSVSEPVEETANDGYDCKYCHMTIEPHPNLRCRNYKEAKECCLFEEYERLKDFILSEYCEHSHYYYD